MARREGMGMVKGDITRRLATLAGVTVDTVTFLTSPFLDYLSESGIMATPNVRYSSLANDGCDEYEDSTEKAPFIDGECRPVSSPHRPRYRLLVLLLVASLAGNVLFLSMILSSSHSAGLSSSTLYSPAQHLLRPTLRKFSSAFDPGGSDALFQQPPSQEVDAAWRGLYYTTLAIDRAAAEPLPNKTIPVSDAPDAPYLTGLSVFHDLHCLDSIRKALWASSSNGTTPSAHDPQHLMHCVNGLRQTLMCHADVAPLSWQWTAAAGDVRVYQDVLHQCRDFDAVLAWGRAHQYDGGLDTSVYPDRHPPEIGRCGVADAGCGDELRPRDSA